MATKRSILHSLLATGLVLALSSMFAPQTVGAVSEGSLHPSWSDSAMAEGWRAVCGDVRNVGQVPARSVAIRVQGLGSTGQVVSTRDHYVLADVPAGSRSVFCVPMPAGATSYNVTVLRADSGTTVSVESLSTLVVTASSPRPPRRQHVVLCLLQGHPPRADLSMQP